jgi:hypothetical protein
MSPTADVAMSELKRLLLLLRAQRYRSCWSSGNEAAAADDARQALSLMLSEGMLPLQLLQCRLSLTSCCL